MVDAARLRSQSSALTRPELVRQLGSALKRGMSVVVIGPAGTSNALSEVAAALAGARIRVLRTRPPYNLTSFLQQLAPNGSEEDGSLLDGAYEALAVLDTTCTRIVLLAEDAHLLPRTTLRYIESALRNRPHVSVALAGLPELIGVLEQPELDDLRERLSLHMVLTGEKATAAAAAGAAAPRRSRLGGFLAVASALVCAGALGAYLVPMVHLPIALPFSLPVHLPPWLVREGQASAPAQDDVPAPRQQDATVEPAPSGDAAPAPIAVTPVPAAPAPSVPAAASLTGPSVTAPASSASTAPVAALPAAPPEPAPHVPSTTPLASLPPAGPDAAGPAPAASVPVVAPRPPSVSEPPPADSPALAAAGAAPSATVPASPANPAGPGQVEPSFGMVSLPGGEFRMGNNEDSTERPVRTVALRPFQLARTAVTVRDWTRCVDAGACAPVAKGEDNAPALNISWNDARAYANWLAAASGQPYRLPTEAEWEYAARAGASTRYAWGNDVAPGRMSCKGCGEPVSMQSPPRVNAHPANAFGLHGMGGGLLEPQLPGCAAQWLHIVGLPGLHGARAARRRLDGECRGPARIRPRRV